MEYYEFKKEDAYEFARVSGIQSKQRGDELQLLSCPYCRGGKNGDKGTFSISLVTGQFKCLRSSCSVSGNMVTLARDFDYFSLGKDIDAYYRILWLKMISSTVYPRAWHFRSLPEKGSIRITNAMQMFMDTNEKHWHYSDLHYRHAEDIHFSNRMEN